MDSADPTSICGVAVDACGGERHLALAKRVECAEREPGYVISPLDSLQLLNSLNVTGSRVLSVNRSASESALPDYDVNADGLLSPLDALLITNYLNLNGTVTLPGEGEGEGFEGSGGDRGRNAIWRIGPRMAWGLPAMGRRMDQPAAYTSIGMCTRCC